jgi:aspartyl-tRNA(Asn)/glutamyl-tRNA(Gln) amidotransferase subunit A
MVFSEVDVLLSFSRPSTAPKLDQPSDRRARLSEDLPPGNSYLKAAANLIGLPGVYFPCGLADDGLPVGLHLVGPPFSEPLLLAMVLAYQRRTEHHLLRPPE